jgi:thiol-disulfide isomerase/thioredoxin
LAPKNFFSKFFLPFHKSFVMRKHLILLLLVALIFSASNASPYDEHKTLPIGASAPDFKLKGVDDRMYTLASFKDAKILVIVFTCNHCPTAQAYEERIIQLAKDYSTKGVVVVAIMPNDPNAISLDELGYTDMSDSFEEMKIRAKEKHYNFPYLYDGGTQATANAYGPVATPHVFIFDKDRKLRYEGRIDNVEKPSKTPTSFDTRNAIDALLANKDVPVQTTKVFGCSIKWTEKTGAIEKQKQQWAQEPVNLDTINEAGLKELVKNNSDKLRVINVWATWCGPCVKEFPDLVSINRMYRERDFEFISISADDPANRDKALKFLQKQQASNTNYIFSIDDKYKLIDAIDPNWQGALPYTIVVEPGGKIIYSKQGGINTFELKRAIVDDPLIGRYYK